MRGKPENAHGGWIPAGITPAHAGKTLIFYSSSTPAWDHPRACGENGERPFRSVPVGGSPPRMRGKLPKACIREPTGGITPAHAGKTYTRRFQCRHVRDHPRACGENRRASRPRHPTRGSPPRMRGKRHHHVGRTQNLGITPAHAGKTNSIPTGASCGRDHPRACGENLYGSREQRQREGSPPRMRGKLPTDPLKSRHRGITPAHAGKTTRNGRNLSSTGDHPRACGENHLPEHIGRIREGSPPRMRGKPRRALLGGQRCGITPAHAGKTSALHLKFCFCRDHPRACGENALRPCAVSCGRGSPPRMRGKPLQNCSNCRSPGITPAHAGKTQRRPRRPSV